MSGKIELTFSLTNDDFQRVQDFKYRDKKLNPLQRLLRRLGEKALARQWRKGENQASKYEFDENGISITSGQEVNCAPWTFFGKVIEHEECYLFISQDAQIQTVVPKRAFQNTNIEQAFRNLLKLKLGMNAKLSSLH